MRANTKYRKTDPSNMDLATIGHALYDIRCYLDEFPKPDHSSFIKGDFKHNPGGSATNVAFNCGQLGMKTSLLAKIGFDSHGKYITERIGTKVDISGVKIDLKNPTGVSLVIINKKGQPEVIEMLGANATFTEKDLDMQILESARNLHMTGTNLPVLEYAARRTHGKVSFDPGRSISRLGWHKLRRILENTDLLAVNEIELQELGGKEVLFDNFELTLIIKRASKPTLAYTGTGKRLSVKPPKVKAIDTIGAGDAFMAGLLYKLYKKEKYTEQTLKAAIKYGHALAAYKIKRSGAEVAFTRRQIDSFAKKLTLV